MKRAFVYIAGFVASRQYLPKKAKDLIMWPIATRALGAGYRQKVFLRDGFYMHGSMEDILSREILFIGRWKRDLWEPKTCAVLGTLAKESGETLIAGSHIGYLVLKAANATRGRVHAFEPVPMLFRASKDNFALNPELDKKIHLNKEALGERSGEVDMYVEDIRSSVIPYSGGHVKHNDVIKARIITIDEYAMANSIAKLDALLLDIEGFEWFALNGAKATLQSKPKMILEISPRILAHTEITAKMLLEKLAKLGYGVEYLDQDDDYANIYAEPI